MDTIYDKLTAIADSIREKTGKSGSLTLDDMAYEISTIKGSADLNFDIVAYETEEALLASSPAENTIGVITTTPITSWSFSTTEPASSEVGMVWFAVGTNDNVKFNALKKNEIQVYPISAKQYISGSWIDVTAKSYQGGEWKTWLNESNLFYYNKQKYTWQAVNQKQHSAGNLGAITPTIEYNADGSVKISYIDTNTSKYESGIFCMSDDFNLTNYKELVLETDGVNGPRIQLSVFPRGNYWGAPGSYNGAAVAITTINADDVTTLDISSVRGRYCIGIGINSGGASKSEVVMKTLTAK